MTSTVSLLGPREGVGSGQCGHSLLFLVAVVALCECLPQARGGIAPVSSMATPCEHDQLEKKVPGTCLLYDACPAVKYLASANTDAVKFCDERTEFGDELVCCPQTLKPELLDDNKCTRYLWEELQRDPKRGNETISRRRCREYASTICRRDPDAFPEEFVYFECNPATPLVLGGTEATLGQLPYMALLLYGDGDSTATCGGTLISENFVLTAAHCVEQGMSGPGTPSSVRLGVVRRGGPDAVTVVVVEAIVHPGYGRGGNFYNDIALLRLNESVSLSKTVRPACLHEPQDGEVPVGHNATVAGWGVTELKERAQRTDEQTNAGHYMSDELLYATLPIVDSKVCQSYFQKATNSQRRLDDGVIASQICAGGLVDKDLGKGDSGGPLLVSAHDDPYCSDRVVGVTSLGWERPGTGHAVLFTRVASYASWIQGHVWNTDPAPAGLAGV